MGGACSTYGGKCIQGNGGETWGKETKLEYTDVDGRVILKWIFSKWDATMDWIYLAQDRDKWRALVNAVMNLRGP